MHSRLRTHSLFAAIALAALTGGAVPRADAEPIQVTDQRGVTITLAKPAERVVFIPIPASSTYIAIDGSPAHVVGANPIAMTAMREGILGRIFPDSLRINTDITRGRFVPNVETILSLGPDAVVQWATEGPDVIVPLEKAGLPTLGIRYGSQEQTEGYTRMFAALAGKPERAEAIIGRQHARVAEIENAVAGVKPADKPSVLYFGSFAGNLTVAGADNNNDETIRMVGATNVAAGLRGSAQSVTYEQVLQWDPQIILLGAFEPTKPSDLYNDPRWQAVRAVREHRVYRYPLGGYRWDPPSQESAMSWTWLAKIVHPQEAKFDLRNEMAEWYQFLYGHRLTAAEIDTILNLAANGDSQGYAQFKAP